MFSSIFLYLFYDFSYVLLSGIVVGLLLGNRAMTELLYCPQTWTFGTLGVTKQYFKGALLCVLWWKALCTWVCFYPQESYNPMDITYSEPQYLSKYTETLKAAVKFFYVANKVKANTVTPRSIWGHMTSTCEA